eukprot:scaffold859_cov429-Prasinococcus_capsulatus_cf.AAC.2
MRCCTCQNERDGVLPLLERRFIVLQRTQQTAGRAHIGRLLDRTITSADHSRSRRLSLQRRDSGQRGWQASPMSNGSVCVSSALTRAGNLGSRGSRGAATRAPHAAAAIA